MKFKFVPVTNEGCPRCVDYVITTDDSNESTICRVYGPDVKELADKILQDVNEFYANNPSVLETVAYVNAKRENE